MNIGSLIRGLLGDNKMGEPKAVELKEGQVVRGVVLSVSESGREAVVQIQGTPVLAELETPLQPGQTLNLQVAPPGDGGLPVLKPVSSGEAILASPQSMGEALESLGLTDSKAGKEIIQAMVSGGIALTKETAAKLEAVMNAKPPNVPVSEWLEAAVISVKRGLPVTAESVRGLQQAVFGPKLHQLVAQLETAIGLWVQQENDTAGGSTAPGGTSQPASASTITAGTAAPASAVSAGGTAAAPVAPAASQAEGVDASRAPAASAESVSAGEAAELPGKTPAGALKTELSAGSSAAALAGNPTAEAEAPVAASADRTGIAPAQLPVDGDAAEAAAAPKAGNAQPPAAGISAAAGGAVPSAEPAEGLEPRSVPQPERSAVPAADASAAGKGTALLAKLQGVLTELRGTLPQLAAAPPADAAGQAPAPAAAQPQQGTTAPPAAAGQETAPAPAGQRGDGPSAAAAQQTGTAPAAPTDTESWVGRVLKLLGAEHEQQAVRGGAQPQLAVAPPADAAGAGQAPKAALPQATLASTAHGGETAADTLKGVLLQVLGSSEVPPAVKEAAGQLVQQLTGQQLLLNTDRTAPFAQVTMFLPLRGPDGQETASVHIQSRRGRKGELDAANCRLWFDLDMKQLGQTLVDVQVVDRIVSLKLHNDTPWVLELLEERKEEIEAAVEAIGYQLLSLRTEPLPQPSAATASAARSPGKLADYVPDSYKGVDYRI
ncbi:DNA ligase [Paenibacillus sonchi]|uniref:DNA ligase n=1 Tax=Paenibacillus sonchi TaxID=373687 RepID=A0A974PAM2_9BACL|nr:DNA ligase [Paenibacillus sonchi]QQZ60359.1 DNA ligase [Paenibacillus sonchi]